MLHLIDKIYYDYDFSGNIGRETIVYIGPAASYVYTEGTQPILQYESLDEVIESYGSIATFIECLVPLNRKVHLMLDEASLNALLVIWLKAIFPDITLSMVHRFVKLNVVNHKYEHSSRTNTKGERKVRLRNLTIPTLTDTAVLFERYTDVTELPADVKERISFEFLLSHCLSVEFDSKDRYVESFVRRMETILWKSLAWDFVETRRDLMYGMYNLKENFGLEIDLERDDIDDQIQALQNCVVFNQNNHPGNVEFIQQNHEQIKAYAASVTRKNGCLDSTFEYLMDILPTGEFTRDKALAVIERDRGMHCSQVFGRTEFRDNMNNNFIGYLYKAGAEELPQLNFNGLQG